MVLLRLIVKRVLFSLLTLLLVSVIIFSALEALPGDAASRILGRDATVESLAAMRQKLNLNRPAVARYVQWIGGFVRGDFGRSLVSGRPITEVLAPRVFNTTLLSLYAFLLYIPLSLFPALISALKRNGAADHAFSLITLLLLSIPDFLLGTLLIIGGVMMLPWFPALSLVDETSSAMTYLRAMTLPALTLALAMAVFAIRMLRDNLIEVMDSDYIRMAELQGVPEWRVIVGHALPNALIPTLNLTALNLAYLIGGVVVVERVFGFPGFGTLLVDAIQLRDLPLIEATMMIAAIAYIAANLAADIATILLNPRLEITPS